MPPHDVLVPDPLSTHVCGARCGRAPLAPAPLPARVTLRAPATMPYAELRAALDAARALGVRRATVVVQRPSISYPA